MTNERPPTAIETLERAISKLEQLQSESPGEFDAEGFSLVFAVDGSTPEASLLIALSRTVEPMLDTLRFARGLFGAQIHGEQAAATVDLALYLARAILGEENDDDR